MEGAHRPGHFNGGALVVSKLFNIIEPDKAYFGQKDYQQFKIISQLANDLLFDVDLIAVPTVREPSGLAKSSRNSRLSDKGRSLASKIHDVLSSLETRLLKGDTFSILKPLAVSELEHSDLKVEYLEFVNEETMYPIDCKNDNVLAVLCIAVTVDGIRLIDNKIF